MAYNNNNNNNTSSSPTSYRNYDQGYPSQPYSSSYSKADYSEKNSAVTNPTEDAMDNSRGYNGRGGQQGQGQAYAMHNMTQHSSQRDTYGLPYLNNNNNNNSNSNSNGNNNGNYYDQYNQNYHGGAGNQNSGYDANTDDAQPQYYNGYDEAQPIQSETGRRNSIHSNSSIAAKAPGVTPIKVQGERSKYLPCFPCIRSTCGRFTCCFCILLILVIIILVILVFTMFKVPTVDYLGMQGDPTFTFNQGNTTLGVNLIADIQVKNPNPIGFNFDSIVVTAYYPGYAPSIGGGNVTHVSFPSKSTKTIQFPVNVSYDRKQDPGFTVIESIFAKCGITGATNGQITINYDIKATTKIIGFTISPSLKNQTTSFTCPVNIIEIAKDIPAGIISGIGGLISSLASGVGGFISGLKL
ncbi:hypothetical protein EDD21DRAFT_360898 [Dissophora ornata]|nr:hypothetical protein BGZ58_008541 [Dissophora ornata]KAI8606424.1 hypothetical protein EDD21DRAFT_360898 [Dissophora ornata]